MRGEAARQRGRGRANPLVSAEVESVVSRYGQRIGAAVDCRRDYLFDTFGINTLLRSYLLWASDGEGNVALVERPQYMFVRVAIGIHGHDVDEVLRTYDMMSRRLFTHASPTLSTRGPTGRR